MGVTYKCPQEHSEMQIQESLNHASIGSLATPDKNLKKEGGKLRVGEGREISGRRREKEEVYQVEGRGGEKWDGCGGRVSSLLVLVAATVIIAKPSDPYQQPSYNGPMPYNFAYGVKDDYAGTDFRQSEDSDGSTVKGSYRVALPDGRIQTVTYVADPKNGYQAQVTYEGKAQYPQEYGPPITFKPVYGGGPSYQAPQPSYQAPRPAYQ
ncbi:hypothetical protein Pcinc_029386 [Petrolisthes cinctipes]|uniref:Uncharacterized protein n=1 Tax=Petrolisthes cinctipes TaxID=88211 RepID=A0AAE1K5X8_PETCI|nr:hypothetical protein Pcinc_029386 [Petrolisthes cinctipes]